MLASPRSSPLTLSTRSISVSNATPSTDGRAVARCERATTVRGAVPISGLHSNEAAGADRDHEVGHARRDVDTGDIDAVAELHGRVDLADQEAAGVLEQIDRKRAAADRGRRATTQGVELVRHRTVSRGGSARRVRDPVIGVAVDGADRLVADDERADVARRLLAVLLQIEDRLLR